MKSQKTKQYNSLKLLEPENEKLLFTKVTFNKWDLIGKGSGPEKEYLRKTGRIQVASVAENSNSCFIRLRRRPRALPVDECVTCPSILDVSKLVASADFASGG